MPRRNAPKVYALLVWAPGHWDITPAPNGSRQVRAVAEVTSKAAMGRLLAEHGVQTMSDDLRNMQETGNATEVYAAQHEPGALFHAVSDMTGNFVKAERKS